MNDFRSDPQWQQARREYVRDASPGETPTGVFVRRLDAVHRMFAIESDLHPCSCGRPTTGERCSECEALASWAAS